jgi:apolipoprotein N-acyltransferase
MGFMKKRDWILSFFSGLLLTLSFPHVDLEFLAWFFFVPLLYALEGKSVLQGLILGFITGFVSFLGTFYWIIVAVHTYGNIPSVPSAIILLLLIAYLSLYPATFGFFHRLLQNRFGVQAAIFLPFLWVALEYLRSFFLTGFPWALLGHTQYLNLPFIQIVDITGVYGLSFAILWVNVTIYLILHQWAKRVFPYREALVAVMIVVGLLVYGYVRMAGIDPQIPQQPSLKVGLAQGNIDQSIKWDESFQKQTLKIYENLSLKLGDGKPDLIIWPETATPFFFQDAREYQPGILDIPRRTNAYLLFGSPTYKIEDRKARHYNSAYLVSPSGDIAGKYDKMHLVPFGEYIPLSSLLFFVESLGEGIGNFRSGREIFNFALPQGKFGVVICFEIIFPDLCRQFVKKGANFLVTITNDAWFGRTSAPHQHFTQAVFRAVENRVFIARAANTGISGFIDPKGKILKQGGIFKEEAISGTLRLMTARTFYTEYGDVFAWICSAVSLFLAACAFVRGRRR